MSELKTSALELKIAASCGLRVTFKKLKSVIFDLITVAKTSISTPFPTKFCDLVMTIFDLFPNDHLDLFPNGPIDLVTVIFDLVTGHLFC